MGSQGIHIAGIEDGQMIARQIVRRSTSRGDRRPTQSLLQAFSGVPETGVGPNDREGPVTGVRFAQGYRPDICLDQMRHFIHIFWQHVTAWMMVFPGPVPHGLCPGGQGRAGGAGTGARAAWLRR